MAIHSGPWNSKSNDLRTYDATFGMGAFVEGLYQVNQDSSSIGGRYSYVVTNYGEEFKTTIEDGKLRIGTGMITAIPAQQNPTRPGTIYVKMDEPVYINLAEHDSTFAVSLVTSLFNDDELDTIPDIPPFKGARFARDARLVISEGEWSSPVPQQAYFVVAYICKVENGQIVGHSGDYEDPNHKTKISPVEQYIDSYAANNSVRIIHTDIMPYYVPYIKFDSKATATPKSFNVQLPDGFDGRKIVSVKLRMAWPQSMWVPLQIAYFGQPDWYLEDGVRKWRFSVTLFSSSVDSGSFIDQTYSCQFTVYYTK